MTSIDASIKVHDGRTIAVPFGEGQIRVERNGSVGVDDLHGAKMWSRWTTCVVSCIMIPGAGSPPHSVGR